jgi:DNA-directed RNA polymerase subunit RPC12/RpoP
LVKTVKKKYSGQKICIDCGKPFDPIIQIDNDKGNTSSMVVCKDCTGLLKKRFWNSMKMEMKHMTNSDITNQGKKSNDKNSRS